MPIYLANKTNKVRLLLLITVINELSSFILTLDVPGFLFTPVHVCYYTPKSYINIYFGIILYFPAIYVNYKLSSQTRKARSSGKAITTPNSKLPKIKPLLNLFSRGF